MGFGADHVAISAVHRAIETRWSEPRIGPSTRCHQHDCIGTSSSPGLEASYVLLCHVLGDRGLPDINSQLEKFTMDPWCAPQGICDTHIANELSDFIGRPRPATTLP